MRRTGGRTLAVQTGWVALRPWLGWVLGPAAWAMHQVFGYALVPVCCDIGSRWPLHVLTAACLTLAAAGAVLAWGALRRASTLCASRSAGRLRLLARVGLMLGAIAVAGILLEYTGSFAVDICTMVPR